MNTKRYLSPALVFLLLVPAAAHADGVSPILNLFHKDTWLPASIVTLVIILVESGLLRWRIKQVPFGGALWRSAALNTASSIAGSAVLVAFGRESFFMWDTMSMVLPLFAVTLATEIPLLRLLYRRVPLTWWRACVVGAGVNLGSYAVVFALEIGAFSGLLGYAGLIDRREAAAWNSPDILKQASGLIYATETVGGQHGLRVYDPRNAKWASLVDCPSLDPEKWDVEGSLCAFVQWADGGWRERHLVVSRLPGFETLLDVAPVTFSDSQFDNWQGVTAVAVSPDQKKLAILFRVSDAVAPKDQSSYFDLGGKCRLIVVDLVSGREMARASRWASDRGLCWLPDSRRVLFPSFDDEALYRTTRAGVRGNTSYGIGYAREARFKRGLYAFDLDTGSVGRFAEGYGPSLAAATGQVLLQDGSGLLLLDEDGSGQERVVVRSLGFRGAVVSPSGDMILAEIERHAPFLAGGRLVILSKAQPEVRKLVDDGFSYRFDWVADEGASKGVEAARPSP